MANSATVAEGLPFLLFNAAVKGDAQAVAAWLDEGGGVDARCAEREGATLLMAAALGGQAAMEISTLTLGNPW